ncbi:MAG: exodeoxyribonuclease VII large subunit, partial [Pseudomonadota bacterium]|nr:exodeoxyribonuclease VII large subunit [Pseudomonadota bacterium]
VEERRRKLAAEGLFDEARKRPLPFLPACIGVVTSPTGAVIRDILHRIAERFPRHVVVWPVRVQGETSAAEIAAAIDGLNALPEHGPLRRPDVIIVARGGGSLEDLWSFNEEIVVRAAARSLVPLIAAVGHETDWTLIDHAADLRAPTPTAAAEKAVPVRSELAAALADLARRHIDAALRGLDRRRGEFRALLRALPQSDGIFALRRQQLDNLESRLMGARAKPYSRGQLGLARLSHRLAQQSPHAKMGRAAERLKALEQRLLRWRTVGNDGREQGLNYLAARLGGTRAARIRIVRDARVQLKGLAERMKHGWDARIAACRVDVKAQEKLLFSLGYPQVLARGFALVRDSERKPLRRAAEVAVGAHLDIQFFDGHKAAVATTEQDASPLKRVASKGRRKREQGPLF